LKLTNNICLDNIIMELNWTFKLQLILRTHPIWKFKRWIKIFFLNFSIYGFVKKMIFEFP
jgi:hypothetical protein